MDLESFWADKDEIKTDKFSSSVCDSKVQKVKTLWSKNQYKPRCYLFETFQSTNFIYEFIFNIDSLGFSRRTIIWKNPWLPANIVI